MDSPESQLATAESHDPEVRRRTRRRLLRTAFWTATGSGVGAFLWATQFEPHWLEVVERELPLAGLPTSLAGSRLIQLSDLHVGPNVDDDYLRRVVRTANELQPDFVAVTGDLVTFTSPKDYDKLSRLLEGLKPGRFGSLAVLGNHDYGDGWKHPEVAAEIDKRLTNAGLLVLRNETTNVNGLQIAGCDDLLAYRFKGVDMWKGWDGAKPGVALCHNPDAVDLKKEWGPFKGWILAGHTHGGQCKPPFLRAPRLPCRNRRYTNGEFDLYDGRTLYINRGVGYLLRARFNMRPELTVFTLRTA